MTTAGESQRAGQKARWLPRAVARRRLCRYRVKAEPGKERKDLRAVQRVFDTESASDLPCAPARRACRCKQACAHLRCSDEGTRVARDRSTGRTRECSTQENPPD